MTNWYYTRTLAAAQGTDGSQMTAEELVEAFGSGWLVSDGKAVPFMTKMSRYRMLSLTIRHMVWKMSQTR